ncbi:MAG: hypothetical protein IJU58_03025 [Clostridia bacterium]|nr:hypothetical protein [Clostridia bacterium]
MKNTKIMGWPQKEIKSMFSFIKKHPFDATINSLTLWAKKHNKQPFSVRNYYYKLLKNAKQNDKINNELCTMGIDVKNVENLHTQQSTMQLLYRVLNYTDKRSVFSVCMEMANNNAALAQKFQNKYRNTLSNNPQLVDTVLSQLRTQGIPTRITFADKKILNMPTNIKQTISDQDLKALVFGVINLIQKNTETKINNDRNKELQNANNHLQKALIDIRRKNILLQELKDENEKIKINLKNSEEKQQQLKQQRDSSYLTIKELLESQKQKDLANFVQKLLSQQAEKGFLE